MRGYREISRDVNKGKNSNCGKREMGERKRIGCHTRVEQSISRNERNQVVFKKARNYTFSEVCIGNLKKATR